MVRTAGSARSWLLLGGLGLAVAVNPAGCGTEGPAGSGSVDADLLLEVLRAVGPEVVLPGLGRFLTEASALADAVSAWEQAVQTGTGEAEQAAAQEAWLATFATWQELELMQLGPAASSLTAAGGEDLRDEIYSFPTVSGCRVDQQTVEGGWEEADFFTENLVNAYGLDAAEHLLFYDLDNDCPGQVSINEEGTWAALGDAGVRQQRSSYAGAVVDEVIRQGEVLEGAWSPEGDDFTGAVSLEASSPYASEQEALNAIFDALFYLETQTKDRKLAQPLGLQECGEETCPEDVEALTSGAGLLAIEANLRGFRTLFTGGEGTGLDDLLVELGHADLSEQILGDTDAAIALAAGMEGDLDLLVETEPESVQDLHDAVKRVTDALKGDLATVLAVEIPSEAAGDND